MKKHTGYHAFPEDFPLPDDISYLDALGATLDRADGINSLVCDSVRDEPLVRNAVWAVTGLIRQAKALTEHWYEYDKAEKARKD